MKPRSAFTLVELLAVLSVIALLLALVLPALQSAREGARRAQCVSNFRQLGIALQSYHDTHRRLPPGGVSRFTSFQQAFTVLVDHGGFIEARNATPETPWVFQLLPFIEQTAAWNRFNSHTGVFGYVDLRPPFLVTGLNGNSELLRMRWSILQCPSDSQRPFDYDVNQILGADLGIPVVRCARGNYAASWGNTHWDQTADLDGDGQDEPETQFLGAPFGRARGSQLSELKDGIDQTILLGEVAQGYGTDGRGAYATPLPGGSLYMSRLLPNSARDWYRQAANGDGGDQMPFAGACASSSGLPCGTAARPWIAFAGSRSAHRGGVHVLFASGRVQFVSDAVDHLTWIRLHGTKDGRAAEP